MFDRKCFKMDDFVAEDTSPDDDNSCTEYHTTFMADK